MSTLTAAPTRGRSAVAWTLQGLLFAAFLNFGVTKYAGGAAITASFEEIGAGQWLRYATGTTEILGALALLYLPLSGLAAAALAAQMVGAAITQVAFVDDGSPIAPIVLGLAALSVAWLRRDRSVETLLKFRLHLLPAAR
jgi:putative oxidoreductase